MRVQTDMIYRLHLCVSKCKSGVCYMNHVSICECSMCDCVHTHPQRKFCVACTYLLHSRQTCLMFQSPPTTFPYHSQDIPQMLIQSSRSVSTHPQNMFCAHVCVCALYHRRATSQCSQTDLSTKKANHIALESTLAE